MKLSGNVEQRLAAHILERASVKAGAAPVYVIVRHPAEVIVVEREEEGEARVECHLPEGALCIQWNLPTGLFQFLKEEKNADGALLIWRENEESVDGHFDAHIMECKKTINRWKWEQILQQWRWTFMRLRAISGTLGVPIRRVTFYAAYREDKLSSTSSRNPVSPKSPLTSRTAESDDRTRTLRSLQKSWEDGEVVFDGFEGHFVHHKIELDARHNGSVNLA